MRKIFLIGIVLLFLTSFGFASTFEINFYKGWNLFTDISGAIENTCTNDKISYACAYSPLNNKYYCGSGGNPLNNYQEFSSLYADNKYFDYISPLGSNVTSASWAYFNQGCTEKFEVDDSQIASQKASTNRWQLDKKIFEGWNFIPITGNWIGLTAGEVFKNCNIQKAYEWSAESQSWGNNAASSGTISSSELTISDIGKTLVVKASADCQLSGTPAISAPPEIPQ